ncbi:MAG: hypothetical protein H7Y20_06100 [Bryobacteraceae bacterium]|nr:hypothetical protein [Bryobacteraceae bacterium]
MTVTHPVTEPAGTGLPEHDHAALLAYSRDRFDIPPVLPRFPLPDERFVTVWRSYAAQVAQTGSIECLQSCLPQLAFPIEEGMSAHPAYLQATRRGIFPATGDVRGLGFLQPERCRLQVHQSCAGAIPVLTAETREDFVSLVRAFAGKNEPIAVPSSMGASMIGGYNNWHRIHKLKSDFVAAGGSAADWPAEFERIKADRDLYQDRFIVLSSGPYSGVDAGMLGLTHNQWIACSGIIRLEHECAHYFTRRLLGRMRNHLVDEIMADYAGLREAFSEFRAFHLLCFLGLEQYPNYRDGGRMQNYSASVCEAPEAKRALRDLVWRAAWNLERFDRAISSRYSRPEALCSIGSMPLEDLADDQAPRQLAETFGRLQAAAATMAFETT